MYKGNAFDVFFITCTVRREDKRAEDHLPPTRGREIELPHVMFVEYCTCLETEGRESQGTGSIQD